MSSDESSCQQTDLLRIISARNFIATRQGTAAQQECWVKANLWCWHQKCVSLCQLWQPRPRGRRAWSQLRALALTRVSAFPAEAFCLARNREPKVLLSPSSPGSLCRAHRGRLLPESLSPSLQARLHFPGRTSWQLLSSECLQVLSEQESQRSTGFGSQLSGAHTWDTVWFQYGTLSKSFPLTPRDGETKVHVHYVFTWQGQPRGTPSIFL